MIQYRLKCVNGHSFESWFQSAAAFDALKASGHLECALCGSCDVDKAIMAPRVQASRKAVVVEDPLPNQPAPQQSAATALPEEMQAALKQMKKHIEENSDYVADKFAQEARSMHLGDTPERAIYGEANGEEIKALIEDDVPIMPLPFTPTKRAN